ncbi:seven-hairpin glycosidase [Delitschia confertaspora ATCC 74209]|uniref:alpha-1,2-Mannosidase n=1 Tax=Delitschia confertaspora ATCC 74209 TaxID=1513339 RepID=A0A9P4MS02_9PLEO|nr:seven-hairpin glycosidase [Delitschia confertaspora ATCC 74209]
MLRFRRYRVFVIFAIITVFAIYQFGSSRSAWNRNGAEVADHTNGDKKPVIGEDAPPPQIAIETKKLEIDIPAATASRVRLTPPPFSSISRPADRPPVAPGATKAKGPVARPTSTPTPTSVALGGHENVSPSKELGPYPGPAAHGEGRVEVPVLPSSVEVIHWVKQTENFPIPSGSTIQLPSGSPKPIPKIQYNFKEESAAEKVDRETKLNIIKEVFNKSWKGYKEHAWLQDELSPVSGKFRNPFAHWGATLVDSLDTLWIMGLKEEFEEAVEAVKKIDFTTTVRADIPLFETTIRYLGGLVAAYDISNMKHEILLKKAVELAEILISAFDTPNRMPQTYYYWRPTFASNKHRASNRVVLAEIGSLSMEFTRLAQLTGEPKYYDAIARITDALEESQGKTRLPGMWPVNLDASGCKVIDYSTPIEDAIPLQAPLDYLESSKKEKLDSENEKATKAKEVEEAGEGKSKMLPLDLPKPLTFVATDGVGKGKIKNWDDDTVVDKNLAGKESVKTKRQLEDLGIDNSGTVPEKRIKPSKPSPSPSPRPECEEQGLVSSSDYGPEQFTLGGMSDSTYEYLPKQYLLLGGLVPKYRTMYEKSIEVVKKNLIFRPMLPHNDDILFSGSLRVPSPSSSYSGEPELEGESAHLTCFAGGMIGMSAQIFDRPEDLEIAKKLTEGCVWSYNSTATGIMPESFIFIPCEDQKDCAWNQTKYWNVLDPGAEDRMESYETRMKSYHEQMAAASAEYSAALASMTAAAAETLAQGPLQDIAQQTAHPTDILRKRQLGDSDDHEFPTHKVDDDPSKYHVLKASSENLYVEGEDGDRIPTKVQDAKLHPSLSPSPTLPVFPAVYSPPRPLSHEEYVQNHLQEERLPPGATAIRSRTYILRPEAIESVFYMYRITGDNYWREAGWKMFTAINDATSAKYGNSAIDDVTKTAPEKLDEMESFWLAETLKYFYLLFAREGVVNLDEWVLNTEAHPFRRPK